MKRRSCCPCPPIGRSRPHQLTAHSSMSTSPVPSAETFWIVSGSDALPRLGRCTPRCSERDRAEPRGCGLWTAGVRACPAAANRGSRTPSCRGSVPVPTSIVAVRPARTVARCTRRSTSWRPTRRRPTPPNCSPSPQGTGERDQGHRAAATPAASWRCVSTAPRAAPEGRRARSWKLVDWMIM